jgi:SagB-type dehydrogenase family enzyme
MTTALHLALRPDARVVDVEGDLSVRTARSLLRLGPAAAVRPALDALRRGTGEDELRVATLQAGGVQALFALQRMLERLDGAGMVARTVRVGDRPLLALEPLSRRARPPAPEPPALPCRLSRFALVRRDGDDLLVEAALGHARVRLHGPGGVALLAPLARGSDAIGLAEAAGLPEDASEWALRVLDAAGALTPVLAEGRSAEDLSPVLQPWEVHDLFFHARSRFGRQGGGYGGTFRFEGRLPAPPTLRPPASAEVVPLPRPGSLAADRDAPFGDVLENRRSLREQGSEPLTLAQLGEFLYRSARVKEHHVGERGEVTRRVYPAGGALYELEVYPVVDRCQGLAEGLYRYDPLAHALERLSGRSPAVEELLTQAWHTADRRSRPQVLLTLTARFGRLQWKYESMAYAAVLKHVGVLYQTFYLVATAMGLAPCALGGGDSDLFAEAAGLDPWEEGSVGEFILGTRAEPA